MNDRNKKFLATATLAIAAASLGACSNANNNDKNDSTGVNNTSNVTPSNGASNNNSTGSNDDTINSGVKSSKTFGTPAALTINSIHLTKNITPGGLDKDGLINPNPGEVEWYNKTVVPGEKGNSVIAGHVTYNGPDVFIHLDKVKAGDKVEVKYKNGKSKNFVVTKTKSVDKNTLRNDQTVWGQNDKAALVLITCDAKSKLIGHHHLDNYVVWTKPVN